MVDWRLANRFLNGFKTRILTGACLLFHLSILFAQRSNDYAPVVFPDNYKAQLDVIYAETDNWKGRLDVYFPMEASKKVPLLINIHGGGWNHGNKESQTRFSSFFKNGFAVANVEYRLVQQATAPAAIQDVRCALAYLYEKANIYNIDTDRIILMGASAGGHLALMAGLDVHNFNFEDQCNIPDGVKIFALINKYGISDLSAQNVKNSKSVKNWLGTKSGDIKFTQAVSPLFQINKNSPPVFIVHGDADPIIPYQQSVIFYDELLKNGIKTKFITVKNGQHGKFITEDKKYINKELWKFLKEIGL